METLKNINWPGWEVTRLIGTGSFGSVYEIQRNLYGNIETAALKIIQIPQSQSDIEELYNDGFDDESITVRFNGYMEDIIREYSLMASLKGNKNVVYCDDVRQIQHEDGIGWDIYIKMELLTPLVKTLGKAVSEEEVINIGIDICNALVLCKEQNIVHRDIKPQNIFVSKDGVYKLGDFGIAKTAERTTSGTKTGTYKYMAPEVYKSLPYGAAADQYSLGMVLYWLLNERRTPFLPLPSGVKAPTVTMEDEARKRRFDGEQIPPPAHGGKQLQAIVLKACTYDPKDRFASAAEMLEALKALKSGYASPTVTVQTGAAATVADGVAASVVAEELTTGTEVTAGRRSPNVEEEATVSAFGVSAAFASQQGQSPTHQIAGQQNEVPPQGQPDQQGSEQYAGASAVPPQSKTEEKKKRGIGAWVAIAAGLVVVIGVVLLLTLGKGKGGENQSDTSADLKNHGSGATTAMPTEPKETLPVQLDWSEWAEELPAYITENDYTIEERTLYQSRNLETTSSSTSDKMDGWELYNTVDNGQWSEWSEWSDTSYEESDKRKVESKNFYRYHDKQTTTSTSSSMTGWTLEGSVDEFGEYGSWSDWSSISPSANENRKIEVRYRYKTKITSESNMPPTEDGWDVEWVEDYTEPWSEWSDNYPSGPIMGKEVEERQVATGTQYLMAHYCTGNVPGAQWKTSSSNHTSNGVFNENCIYHSLGWYDSLSSFTEGNGGYIGSTCSNSCWTWYIMDTETTYKTQYHWRWHYNIYHNYKWGEWSSWSSNAPGSQSDRQIETQYRYRDREKTTVYSYYRWTDWTNWSETSENETETHKGEKKKFYRYKDLVEETVYYFQRWSQWTDYTESPIEQSETVEVQAKTQYRFKSKEQ